MKQNDKTEAVSLLQATALFRAAGADALLRCVASDADIRSFMRGGIIFSNEHYQPVIGLIMSGSAKVLKGRAVINTLEKGSLFGAVTLFGEKRYYATEITAATRCKVLFLSRKAVSSLMADNHLIAESYIAYLSQRIYFLTEKIESFTAGTAEERLANYLTSAKTQRPDGLVLVEVHNFSLLARELDIGRASLYRAIECFSAQGAIERRGKEIVLKDEKKLVLFKKINN